MCTGWRLSPLLQIVILLEPTQRGIPVIYTIFPQKVHGASTTPYLGVKTAHSISRRKQGPVSPLRAHLTFLASYFREILNVSLRCSEKVCWFLPLCLKIGWKMFFQVCQFTEISEVPAFLHVLRWGYFSLKQCFGGEFNPEREPTDPFWKFPAGKLQWVLASLDFYSKHNNWRFIFNE